MVEKQNVTYIVDVNLTHFCAQKAHEAGNYFEALALYLVLARSDDSLDAGEVGYQISQCYKAVGDEVSARYWADRAVAENSAVFEYVRYRDQIASEVDLLIINKYKINYVDYQNMSKKMRETAKLRGQSVWPPDPNS